MSRARKPCNHAGCPELQPCADHPPAWQTSTRRERSGMSGWAQQRRARRILAISRICHVCHGDHADQVDHVVPLAEGGADDESNLLPIHSEPCHREKTALESARNRLL